MKVEIMPNFKLVFTQNIKLLLNQRIISIKKSFNKYVIKTNDTLRPTVKDLPGPKPSLPIIGTSWQYYKFVGKYDIHLLHEVLSEKFQKYGPIFKEEYQRNKPIVYICDPKDIEIVFRFQGKCPIRPTNDFVIHHRNKHKDKYNSIGIVNMNGIEWYKSRQSIAPALLKMNIIKHYVPNLDDICKDFIKYIESQITSEESNENYIIDFRQISYNFVFESITSWCLNIRFGCLDISSIPCSTSDGPVLINATKELFECYQKLFYSTKLWKYFKTKAYHQLESAENCIYSTLSKYVDSALNRNTNSTESLMNELLKLNVLSPNEIKVTLMDFIIGGLFTVSNALNFVCYHLAKNTEIQQKLYEEINKVMKGTNDITIEKLSQMPYLKACIKESFRLTSTIPGIMRALPTDVYLSGYYVPKGTLIFANFMTASLSEQYFPNPKSYIPERWIGKARHSIPAFSVLPFGFGNRMCVGKHFAQLHIQMAVISIINKFKLSIKTSDEIKLICDFLIIPDRKLKFNVEKRIH